MSHLRADEFVDLAEGRRDEEAFPHLTVCDSCRRQLDGVRAAMTIAADADDIPEPSPLFWEHLSSRVHAAIATDTAARSALWRRMRIPVSAVAAAAVVVLAVATLRFGRQAPAIPRAPSQSNAVAVVREPLADIDDSPTGDHSLTLVAELTATLDFDGVRDAGLAGRGAAEHAVTHLNDNELRELRRLIEQEMVTP